VHAELAVVIQATAMSKLRAAAAAKVIIIILKESDEKAVRTDNEHDVISTMMLLTC
jgi:hypothetical protein